MKKVLSDIRRQRSKVGKQLAGVALLLLCGRVMAGSHPYRGLWVGQARLNYVNEVSIPYDENNVAIAPDPNVPTATSDQAQIRLILHVNGSGQVNLLKDVAIMRRTEEGETNKLYSSEADYSLVTDDSLYPDFPEQQARRIASAVFDFSDAKATEAVDALVLKISQAVAESVMSKIDAGDAQTAAEAAAADIIPNADVAESFDAYLKDTFPSKGSVEDLAISPSYESEIDGLRPGAQALADKSFYNDTRAVDMLNSLQEAIAGAATDVDKKAAALNVVSRYADVENLYERFVHGKVFGDLIREAAFSAANNAAVNGITRQAIDDAIRALAIYSEAASDAQSAKIILYGDTASEVALESVVTNIAEVAYAASSAPAVLVDQLASELEATGFQVVSGLVQGMVSVDTPSSDYTEFVRSDEFAEAVSVAAEAAAQAAVDETGIDPFYTESSLEGQARIAATTALTTVYSTAGRAKQTALPLSGVFEQGSGDARLVSTIESTDAPLGQAGLTGTIKLPANHPTNPFRHRRHPDHTVGFDIERRLRFDFDGASTNALSKTGLGVERITGIYREEIFGLHKPLGPEPSTAPIGLKVEGTFELNRISLIDTLNAR